MNLQKSFTLSIGWLALGLAPLDSVIAANTGPVTPTATSTGSLSGRVQNRATGAYLEGATVTLEPTRQIALTARDGGFYFPSLPPGDYRISISYTGLDAQTISVAVASGASVAREIGLTSQIYAMEAFVVAGEREGNALAITQQRNAPNVKNVISADAFGNIADQNIGNLLMRLPGVAEEIIEGEVLAVSIRGISSEMNAVTVDGTRSASGITGSLNRGFAIDRIPADFVERIEVTKALTPDMDGDAIGGAVNLRTKSPLDHKGRILSYTGGTSWNLDRNTFQPIGSFLYSAILGKEQKLGVLMTASYNKTHKPRDSVYQNWPTIAETDVPSYYWMETLGEDLLKHERIGVGARVDYKLSPTHRVSLNTMYSDYHDSLDRRHIVMAPTLAQVRPGWTDAVTETINQTVSLSQNHRVRAVETVNIVLGGEKRFTRSFLDYGANFSHSAGTEDRVIPTARVTGIGFRFDRSKEIKFPTVTQISGPDINDRTEHRIPVLNFQDFDDTDLIKGAHINWKKPFSAVVPASFKTGLRYRGQERDRTQKRSYYAYVGRDGIAGPAAATGINDDNVGQFADLSYQYRSANGRYAPVPALDPDLLVQHWRANPTHYTHNIADTERDGLRANGTVTEDVFATYAMGDVRLGRLDILAGVRVEETRLTGRGVRQEITLAERARRLAWVGAVTNDELRRRTIAEWSNLREGDGEYRSVLPSIHFKYNAFANMIVRASYSTGIGRPDFSELLRTTTVNNENRTVVAANPDLRPQTTDNFDLSAEYYFEPAGFVSAGVFLKEIKDFVYGDENGVVGPGSDNGFGGDYEGYALVSNFNGGSARVRGFELAYQQRLAWLPGAWKGLGLMANYTRLESRGNYSAGGGTVTGAQLRGFVPETFNAGLSYARGPWDAQLKMIYRSEVLDSFSSNPVLRRYRFSRKSYDLNLKYNWRPGLSFFMDVINIFDDPIADNYVYIKTRIRQTQVFTPAIKAGISGRF